MMMVSQSSREMMIMISNVQNTMTATDNGNNTDYAMTSIKSIDQQLKSEVTAADISGETITGGGD
jgi:hypothetical protein